VRARRGVRIIDLERIEGIRSSSPRRFIDGGAAMLIAVNKNHHIDIAGRRVKNPLVRNKLRVEETSYKILARAKSAGEQSPWASIIVRVPFQPQEVSDIVPAIITPIWATDE